MKVCHGIRSLRSCERGSTAVEFAFIGLLLIASSVGLVDLGRGLYLYNKMSGSVEHAARRSLIVDTTDEQLTALILEPFPSTSSTSGDTPDGIPKVTVTTAAEFRLVEVGMSFTPIVPAFFNDKFDMKIARRFPKAS
jgi:Flp pilus assembly protein TadG